MSSSYLKRLPFRSDSWERGPIGKGLGQTSDNSSITFSFGINYYFSWGLQYLCRSQSEILGLWCPNGWNSSRYSALASTTQARHPSPSFPRSQSFSYSFSVFSRSCFFALCLPDQPRDALNNVANLEGISEGKTNESTGYKFHIERTIRIVISEIQLLLELKRSTSWKGNM